MLNPAFSVFFLTFSAFTLLTLITFSVPFISSFYFLRTSQFGGMKFGMWGWCYDLSGLCSPKQFGYIWKPQIEQLLTQLHVLHPIVLCTRHIKMYPFPLFSILSLLSFLCSLAALIVSLVTWLLAKKRFENVNIDASLGPLIWMSVAATAVLMLVSVTSGCGTICRGRWGRRSWDTFYTY